MSPNYVVWHMKLLQDIFEAPQDRVEKKAVIHRAAARSFVGEEIPARVFSFNLIDGVRKLWCKEKCLTNVSVGFSKYPENIFAIMALTVS